MQMQGVFLYPERAVSELPANRDDTGKFIKGISGNPAGRPKVPQPFKDLIDSKSIPALKRIIAIMEDPKSKPADVYTCAKLILEYANGKPMEKIEISRPKGDMADEIEQELNAIGSGLDSEAKRSLPADTRTG